MRVLFRQNLAPSDTDATELCSKFRRNEAPMGPTVLAQLCEIFNENEKWKAVANALDYGWLIDTWTKQRDPAKMLFKFAEVLKIVFQTNFTLNFRSFCTKSILDAISPFFAGKPHSKGETIADFRPTE